ncbi:MAG TPA: proton-conducting transporter membrane subunit [Bacteriovoracaceae bacterium]|nr:proton-conducting transporter membrane subunit [Bacteriovoracaceae bacterium]
MIESLFLTLLTVPFVLICLLGLMYFSKLRVPERYLSDAVKYISFALVVVSFVLFAVSVYHSPSFLLLDYDDWITIGEYSFKFRFLVDLLGATYAFLTCALIGIIFKFSRNYLHKEEGYFRFIFLLSILLFGLIIVSFSRSLDLLFAGWELVGTTSVLLISYFYTQNQPVRHSLKAIVSYRLCDMGILAAAAWAHLYLHSTDFFIMPTLLENFHHSGTSLVFIGLFIIWASLAKAGQLPMSSWLPTAMEGPTPSSAIFYGALSVHLGPFLLLRFYHYIAHFPQLLILIGFIGVSSAVYASLVGRTRSDAKTMLAYATITQVGIIYLEIALGFTNFAIFHMVAHASFRTYQFLRSSSLIQDFVDNPKVEYDVKILRPFYFGRFFSAGFKEKLFVHALHGFHLDHFTSKAIDAVCAPAWAFIRWEKRMMELDRSIVRWLTRRGKL